MVTSSTTGVKDCDSFDDGQLWDDVVRELWPAIKEYLEIRVCKFASKFDFWVFFRIAIFKQISFILGLGLGGVGTTRSSRSLLIWEFI